MTSKGNRKCGHSQKKEEAAMPELAPAIPRSKIRRPKSAFLSRKIKAADREFERDYSAFGSVTEYEASIIDRLRGDGVSDADIKKCLREL